MVVCSKLHDVKRYFCGVKRIFLLLASALLIQSSVIGQSKTDSIKTRTQDICITWGYNRAYYNTSDIHFQGEGFDFTLLDANAIDDPEPFDVDIYLNPKRFTVPQFNFRASYFINENTSISGGWDHMKYVLQPNQLIRIDGYIEEAVSVEHAGEYHEELKLIEPSFIKYEHTDGFNVVRFGVERFLPLWTSKKHPLEANLYGGVSAGFMLPWTDFTFAGTRHENWLHLAGWTTSAQLGARFEWLDCLFLQAQAHYGYAALNDVILQGDTDSRASQNVVFFERSLHVGGYIPLGR